MFWKLAIAIGLAVVAALVPELSRFWPWVLVIGVIVVNPVLQMPAVSQYAAGGGPIATASSASRTCLASASASEWTATVLMPMALAVRITRQAISPRLAMSSLANMAAEPPRRRPRPFAMAGTTVATSDTSTSAATSSSVTARRR